jgi:hypothetical protein
VKCLLPERAIEEVSIDFGHQDIVDLSNRYEANLGILVGTLQSWGVLGDNQGNNLKRKVNLI